MMWLFFMTLTTVCLGLIMWPLRQQRKITLLLISVFLILPLFLYAHFGDLTQVQQASAIQKNMADMRQEILKLGSKKALIAKLKAKIAQNPQQATGWYLLAKLHLNSRELAEAKAAITQAIARDPTNISYQLADIEINFVTKGHLSNADKKGLTTVLAATPNNINALNIYALDAYAKKEYQLAIQYWQKILSQVSADSDDAASIRKMIDQAKTQSKKG